MKFINENFSIGSPSKWSLEEFQRDCFQSLLFTGDQNRECAKRDDPHRGLCSATIVCHDPMNDPSRGQIDPQKDFQELNHPSVRSMYRANVKVVVEHLCEKDRQRVNAADPDHRPRDRVLQQVEECEKHQLAPESILRWRVRVEAKRGTSIEQSQQDLAMESAFVSFEYRDSPRCEQIFRVPHSRASLSLIHI